MRACNSEKGLNVKELLQIIFTALFSYMYIELPRHIKKTNDGVGNLSLSYSLIGITIILV